MTDGDTLKELLRTAIQCEADAAALYTHVAQCVKSPDARVKFERLAEMERNHRKIVEDVYTRLTGEAGFQPRPADLPDLSSEETIRANAKSALEMAIAKEKDAQEFYRNLAEQLGESEGIELCRKMEQEESSHQKMLEDELRVLNNQSHWYPILEPPWNIKEDL